MHLLAAQPGGIADGAEAVDLAQTPGDIVFASAADTELSSLAAARQQLAADAPSLRLANLMQLSHNLSVDLWVDQVVRSARLVVVRVLGGIGYWPYGVARLADVCRANGVALAVLPGDDKPDPDLVALGTISPDAIDQLWRYLIHGGNANAVAFLNYAAHLIGEKTDYAEPAPLPRAGFYWPGLAGEATADAIAAEWTAGQPATAVLFYRALVQGGHTAPIDALVEELSRQGLNPLPIFVASLRDPPAAQFVSSALAITPPAIVLTTCAFAVSTPDERRAGPLDDFDAPVFQVVFAGNTKGAWAEGNAGLSARDIAMHVALPEVDGRILTRAVAFKTEARRDAATETTLVAFEAEPDRVRFVATLAAAWARLRNTPANERRIGLVLANYPNQKGRIGNGVGLDTPESTAVVLNTLAEAGYQVDGCPANGEDLMDLLSTGITNDHRENIGIASSDYVSIAAYREMFSALPDAAREATNDRWGLPEDDPFFRAHEHGGAFAVPVRRFGNISVMVQPARGYNIDPVATYHDPALVPPHGYFAAYFWLRQVFSAHAIVHVGKHGNLEWLPGKALALSSACMPEAVLGPMPHIYPFIVNDPGEGSQAKRRAQAVIIDHLTPPLTRAESYGELRELETLVDEYFEASQMDRRRLKPLAERILSLVRSLRLDTDCDIAEDEPTDGALAKLDGYLCELKEMQIRDGLHIFGRTPQDDQRRDLLTALARCPRGGRDADRSLTRALATDLELEFDPLDCDMAAPWTGPRPDAMAGTDPWRTHGDTVERLEALASDLITNTRAAPATWRATRTVLDEIETRIGPALDGSGPAEAAGLLRALDGRFVTPGPSGAPTRGRPEVLPTGRNFYSVDTRAVPTAAAWSLGWKSAQRLVEQYAQDHGDWPHTMALSAWGTSNMRTGGDDIAQALALIGARPTWDTATGRVTGFEIMPAELIDRPRVDVTLRVSGFFRDAFPGLIALFDSAVRAVAALDEPASINPLAARVSAERAELIANGADETAATQRAGYRVFGSMPGAYGAGLQALIDEGGWNSGDDLADAYLAWGGWAYGAGTEGRGEHALFETRLGHIEAVVHNQDNREHDLLDSDDYYQFEGGLTAAVRKASGADPVVYHNDHSNPENPRIRTLQDEIGRVVRGRAANPKWINGMMRHGYKGAFEMAATVDYLFAFAATTRAVKHHHFEMLFNAYLADDAVRGFIEQANPAALREMAARFREAIERGLWQPHGNRHPVLIDELLASATGEAAE
ncbi:MAG: cobaltochelatase subunit CobN [Alphaproteobacteria bacterium]|jgi:cobaltochelatase CobN|nr:cobaltochelatase subunit CobN [Alphaproteobacteria bacterium]